MVILLCQGQNQSGKREKILVLAVLTRGQLAKRQNMSYIYVAKPSAIKNET